MSDWEERMSAKAKKRQEASWDEEEAQRAIERAQWFNEHSTTVEAYVDSLAAEYTYEDALNYPAIACACTGAPPCLWWLDNPPCSCKLSSLARQQVLTRRQDGKV